MQGTIRLFAFSLASVILHSLYGGDTTRQPAEVRPPSSGELPMLLAGLDSPEYHARQSAARVLTRLLEIPANRSAAERYLEEVPGETLSFEARQQLTALGVRRFGGSTVGVSSRDVVSASDVASLVKDLGSDRYRDRSAAAEQLRAAARQPRSIDHVYPALKRAAAGPANSTDVHVALAAILQAGRYTWLTGAAGHNIDRPSPVQIKSWIDKLSAPTPSAVPQPPDRSDASRKSAARDASEWELIDALAREDSAPAVKEALASALARGGLDDDAVRRLRRLEELSRPGLSAEYWQRRHNLAIQYFVVGVASQAPGALRPTRFDRVGDDSARCTSGNSLEPGEYPLGVAFPHPREQAALFHLVSLPTARERLIYQYETEALDDGERLREITERTLGPALVNKRPLDDAQLWLLGQLDQPTVARLLRLYFAEVPDEPFDLSQLAPMLTDVASVHRTACLMLALDGSFDVVPTLVEAAENKRFMNLTTDEPQAVAWIAALSIAAREPWDRVDEWLAGLVERTDLIAFGQESQADVGATAAAMLLARNGRQPGEFRLLAREPLRRGLHDRFEAPINADYRRRMFEDRMFKQLGVTPFFFADSDGRAAVIAWWTRRQSLPSAFPAPKPPAPSPAFTARAARP